MNSFKPFLTLSGALTFTLVLSACDNGSTLVTGEENRGIETIDFFGMESGDSDTIPYSPELGFALPARGALSVNTALIGSTTAGADYRSDCATGTVLAGIEGFATGNQVSQVGAKCVEVDADGVWLGTPLLQGNAVGVTSGNPFTLDCANGQGVTGITGLTRNNAVASLQIHCKSLSGSISTQGAEQDSQRIGENNQNVGTQLCGAGAVATGIHGRADNNLKAVGLVCNESPATAGRWGNPIDWPVQAVHAVMTPEGGILSYGFRNGSGNVFDYDVWDPQLGTSSASHNTFASNQGVVSFCSASIVMPSNGNILLPGGTKINSDNAGVASVPVYNTETGALTSAPDMANRRWYPSTVTLPSGEILVAGGRDVAGVSTNTPEIYSPDNNEWRSLFGANMLGLDWTYPRLWVAEDGRVFGVSGTQMYYINTEGSGAIQKVGTYSNDYRGGSASTAVMYRPGKIIQLGGNRQGGTNAFLIDINGATPQTRPTSKMRLSRTAWVDSQVMADGKVMAIGGSLVVNDAPTAALNAEIWDPDTEEWTVVSGSKWPRLYHSNSLLLKDATVFISGGGNPGPVTNYNAEIFTPPYLFNADGTPATRPAITWAPTLGAYGQTITLNTDGSDIQKVTFIKTSAVTHSFNVEQRYIELPFTEDANGSLQVELPADAKQSTPGYYMMFVLNQQGTPSEAAMIKLGDVAGEEPPAPVTPPEPADIDENILVNGGFEDDKTGWFDCSDATLSTVVGNASGGEKALAQTTGACLYQEFAVQPGATYTVDCSAFTQNSSYSSVSLNMLDASYTELASDTLVVTQPTYTAQTTSLQAPQNASYSAVTLYSEGPTRFDSCIVTAGNIQPPAPPEPPTPPVVPNTSLLANGEFDQGKTGWFDCSSEQLTSVIEVDQSNVMQVANAGCIYQEFPVIVGKEYRLQCSAKSEGSQYSSISFQMADASYSELDSKVSFVAPGQFQTYTSTIIAPVNSTTSAVTLYSEDVTQIDVCYVEEI